MNLRERNRLRTSHTRMKRTPVIKAEVQDVPAVPEKKKRVVKKAE